MILTRWKRCRWNMQKDPWFLPLARKGMSLSPRECRKRRWEKLCTCFGTTLPCLGSLIFNINGSSVTFVRKEDWTNHQSVSNMICLCSLNPQLQDLMQSWGRSFLPRLYFWEVAGTFVRNCSYIYLIYIYLIYIYLIYIYLIYIYHV